MFENPKGFFSICTVDNCMKVSGAVPGPKYDVLRLYHCVRFAEMTPQQAEDVFKLTLEVIAGEQPAVTHVKTVKFPRLE
jgi:hypothetical protein